MHGWTDHTCCSLQSIPIIDIPGFGTLAAEVACKQLGVKNAGDAKKLTEAKAMVYLKGFTAGIMTVGNYKGAKVNCLCDKSSCYHNFGLYLRGLIDATVLLLE